MRHFTAAYITTNGEEWKQPFCVEQNIEQCKQKFCDWYKTIDYTDCSIRYAPVEVSEIKEK